MIRKVEGRREGGNKKEMENGRDDVGGGVVEEKEEVQYKQNKIAIMTNNKTKKHKIS